MFTVQCVILHSLASKNVCLEQVFAFVHFVPNPIFCCFGYSFQLKQKVVVVKVQALSTLKYIFSILCKYNMVYARCVIM